MLLGFKETSRLITTSIRDIDFLKGGGERVSQASESFTSSRKEGLDFLDGWRPLRRTTFYRGLPCLLVK